MGNCDTLLHEGRWIIHEDITHLFVRIEAVGDCPIGLQGWHYKAVGKEVPALEAMIAWLKSGDYLTAPLMAPSELKP